MTHIYVLLGGLYGPDGAVDSGGMIDLARRLKPYGTVEIRFWSDYERVIHEIVLLPKDEHVILVGFSGGGSRATWVAGAVNPREIALLVAYDPSPRWQMTPLHANVLKAICYHNNSPLMFGLGGGHLQGRQVTEVDIGEQHLLVQYDERLHTMTINAIKETVNV